MTSLRMLLSNRRILLSIVGSRSGRICLASKATFLSPTLRIQRDEGCVSTSWGQCGLEYCRACHVRLRSKLGLTERHSSLLRFGGNRTQKFRLDGILTSYSTTSEHPSCPAQSIVYRMGLLPRWGIDYPILNPKQKSSLSDPLADTPSTRSTANPGQQTRSSCSGTSTSDSKPINTKLSPMTPPPHSIPVPRHSRSSNRGRRFHFRTICTRCSLQAHRSRLRPRPRECELRCRSRW
ncbi:hypothetical protein NA56DRAFT_169 [Hyaloscypha hepaticicola]|uniref:Uncharacterized protein n=1 Tax=Hyaloscypha hepaticicola TaxID=2082293 RepID=A0A2J6QP87_9HELO|nr:hypothetical protein NA56DRAFT_169 [Hyaloscypha hepaticicola]